MFPFRLIASVGALALGLACNQSDFGSDPIPPGDTPPGPGDPAWGDDDVSCATKSDCSVNEDCIDSVCQMPRCTDGPYKSAAPLGPEHYFFNDLELIVADANFSSNTYWVDTYQPTASSITYTGGGSHQIGAYRATDVAGGNFLGSRPEVFAMTQAGRQSVTVFGPNPVTMPLTYVPVAVGSGDVDHDSIDEVVTIGSGGKFSVCHADENRCETWDFGAGVTGQDIAAGDVDGDGYAEPVMMVRNNGKTELLAFNYDYETSGEQQILGLVIDTTYMAMDVGDPDGNGVAEVYALEDGGFAGFAKDNVHAWQIGNTTRLGSKEVDADSKDITFADTNMSGRDKLLVLRDTRTVEVYQGTGPGAFSAIFTAELTGSTDPKRLAVADLDGDSPSARRISQEPEIIATQPIPTMVLNFPPYSRTHSAGEASLFVGSGEDTSEDFTDSVGLSASVQMGVGVEFPGIFSADVSVRLSSYVSRSRTLSQLRTIGMRFKIDPDPDLYGDNYSVVVMGSACYHSYKYVLSDPAGKVGGDGGEFVLLVPVGGQSTVWSSQRYNALARALGTLPEVTSTIQIGNPASYPSYPERMDSDQAVPSTDMVFKETPTFLVSDVGNVGWWLTAGERETNATTQLTGLEVSSNIKVGGFKFGSSVGGDIGSGYGVSVGQYATFGGGVPEIPDNPDTPEDEYEAHRYTFAPYVYRQIYQDAEGNDAGYYVLHYAVGN